MINVGDLVKNDYTGKVFICHGFSRDSITIPDGWIMTETGSFQNPEFCSKYNGATSCFEGTLLPAKQV